MADRLERLSNLHEAAGTFYTENLTPIPDISNAGLAPQFQGFLKEVKNIYPSCEFSMTLGSGRDSYSTVVVYHPYKPFSMGLVSYKNAGDGPKYEVISRNIANARYSTYNHGKHHHKASKNVEVAIRNVKKYLRDMSPTEIATVHDTDLRDKWSATSNDTSKQVQHAWSKVTDYQRRTSPEENNPLLNELKAIVNSGYTFVDKSLEEEVHKLLAITKEKDQQTRDTTQCMWLVVVEEAPTGVRFSVAYTEEVDRWRSEWQEKGVFVEETLQANHPDIVGKLAMLQMCEIGQWVDGIGYKAAPTVYYVVR